MDELQDHANMRTLFITLALIGFSCGDGGNSTPIDAPVTPPVDALPTAKLDCPTYCTQIQTNCTGLNAQYGGMDAADATAHCMSTCAKFTPGALADTAGHTLGCRIHYSGALTMATPATHCIHAGPAGDQVDVAAPGTCGDACTSFCTLEIAVCGSLDAPITGVPAQYQNMATCLTACNGNPTATPPVQGFDKTHKYIIDGSVTPTVNPRGDSLACRLYYATNAATSMANAVAHCPHTTAVPVPGTPCNGAAAP